MKRLAAHYSSVRIFYSTTIAEGICYLLKQSRYANRQSKVGVVAYYLHLQLSEKSKQFDQQESDTNEAHNTFSGGFLS